MSFILRTAFIFILLNGLTLFHAQAKDTISILIFGDSIVAGYRIKQSEAVPAQLESFLRRYDPRITVINGGVSGNTTAGGRNRLEWTLKKYNPDIVLLALGGNDVLRGVPPETMRDNLNAMLALLQKKQIITILSAVEAPDNLGAKYKNAVTQLYNELARTYNVPLYPFLLEKTYGNKELMLPDGIHPSPRGATVIARDLAVYLVRTISFKSF